MEAKTVRKEKISQVRLKMRTIGAVRGKKYNKYNTK